MFPNIFRKKRTFYYSWKYIEKKTQHKHSSIKNTFSPKGGSFTLWDLLRYYPSNRPEKKNIWGDLGSFFRPESGGTWLVVFHQPIWKNMRSRQNWIMKPQVGIGVNMKKYLKFHYLEIYCKKYSTPWFLIQVIQSVTFFIFQLEVTQPLKGSLWITWKFFCKNDPNETFVFVVTWHHSMAANCLGPNKTTGKCNYKYNKCTIAWNYES